MNILNNNLLDNNIIILYNSLAVMKGDTTMFNIVDDLFKAENPKSISEKDKLLYLSRLAIINKSHYKESGVTTHLTDYEQAVLNGVYLVTRFVNENIAPEGLKFGVILSFDDVDEDTIFHQIFKKNNNGISQHLDHYAIYPRYDKQLCDQDFQNDLSNSQFILFGLIGIVKSLCNKQFYQIYDQDVSIKLPHKDSDKLIKMIDIFKEDFDVAEDVNGRQDILLLRLKRKDNDYQKNKKPII